MYGYIVNTVKKISYKVLGKESRKIKRKGWIKKDLLEEIEENTHAYQKWLSSSKEEDKKSMRKSVKLGKK
jgi:uncharacterized protein (DUF2235 family)